ncbi:catalase-related domain-containing protein [Kitasatospora sp. NPDC127067]|uniref:catalase-related domain-containing protein n=1 Tax=Kitasatospora sp. NPDC127067 TaxID=3347126 RepID=UPI00365FD7C8
MADWEQRHIVEAFAFELGKVEEQEVRRRMVGNLVHVSPGLAMEVARHVGVPEPEAEPGPNPGPKPEPEAASGPGATWWRRSPRRTATS